MRGSGRPKPKPERPRDELRKIGKVADKKWLSPLLWGLAILALIGLVYLIVGAAGGFKTIADNAIGN